jgi:hypothetical protein
MNMRKIAVVGGLAAGAALALAPLAAADDPVAPLLSGEESILNGIFVGEADLAGVGKDVIGPTATQPFDTIPLGDAPKVAPFTPLDYELYGLNPAANAASDPGAYSVFNGALTEFYDASNIELYSLLNPSAAIDTIPATDLIGSTETIADAFANGPTASDVATYFFEFGANDLSGYLDLPAFFPSLIP